MKKITSDREGVVGVLVEEDPQRGARNCPRQPCADGARVARPPNDSTDGAADQPHSKRMRKMNETTYIKTVGDLRRGIVAPSI